MATTDTDRLIDRTFNLMRIMRRRMVQSSQAKDPVKNWLQVHALAMIDERPGITMKELADLLMVTAPTATTFIGRLVRLKCVRRVADPKNRKLVRLRITPNGKHLLQQNMTRKMAVLRSIVSRLPLKDQRELARIYQHLIDSFSSSPFA